MLEITYHMTYWILFIELAIALTFIVAIIVTRVRGYLSKKRRVYERKLLTREITRCLVKRKPFSMRLRYCRICKPLTLLAVLRDFDIRFEGGDWEKLKNEIYTKYLGKRARRWANSQSWTKRSFSSHCIALAASPKDRELGLKFLEDPVFLVRSNAAEYVLRCELKEGIERILQRMVSEPGFAYFFYRDVLIKGSEKLFLWIEELAVSRHSDAQFYLACLDVLQAATVQLKNLELKKDLESEDIALKLAVIQLLSHNPQPQSAELLLASLNDQNHQLRAKAAAGLRYFISEDSLQKLSQSLRDPHWDVRTEAANTLRVYGDPGLELLRQQRAEDNEHAYEAAQYALGLR